MNNFISHKIRGCTWYSPPFYSHDGGYKMCLRVDADGGGNAVLVYVCLMHGENDCNLKWPFRGAITIQLLNQGRDEGHVVKTAIFNDSTPDICTHRVYNGERTCGWGFNKFIFHSDLHYDKVWNTSYLKNDCLQFQITQIRNEGLPAKAQSSIPRTKQLEPPLVPPINIVMSNVTSYKIQRISWYSPPFYSHDGGYKMCLRVDVDRGGKVENAVLVYMCLMHGENDCNLKWPFRGAITIQLLNQGRDEGHVVNTAIFNDNTPDICAHRVYNGERTCGWGFNEFIFHSDLHYDKVWNTKYLKNDCLQFQITQIKLSGNEELPARAQSSMQVTKQPELPLIPPINILMNNFTSYRIQRISWYSRPFYSHIGGYKMCLCVDANEHGRRTDTHLRVWVCLMRGEPHDDLPWPFRGDINITVQLVNQKKDDKHIEKIIQFSDDSKCTGRVIDGEIAFGNGYRFPHSALHYDDSWNTEYLKDDCLQFQITQVKLSSNAEQSLAEAQSSIPRTKQPELPLILPIKTVMSNFTSYRVQSISWSSYPFYSHVGGYKMCLCVDANEHGTHLKVCVCLMHGECDDHLPWPFRGDITVQLVNQRRNDRHMEMTIRFDDNTCTGRVAEGERAFGNGYSIPHSALFYDDSRNTEYLENDCLQFQITQVKLTKSSWLKLFRRSHDKSISSNQ